MKNNVEQQLDAIDQKMAELKEEQDRLRKQLGEPETRRLKPGDVCRCIDGTEALKDNEGWTLLYFH